MVNSIDDICRHLHEESNALCVVLVDETGAELGRAGLRAQLPPAAVPLLLAALDFASLTRDRECATRLGHPKGTHLHASLVKAAILVVIFDDRTSLGLVRLRAKKAAEELQHLVGGSGPSGAAGSDSAPAAADSPFAHPYSRELSFTQHAYRAMHSAFGALQGPEHADGKDRTHTVALLMLARATTALFSVMQLFSMCLERDATTVARTIIELEIDLKWILKEDSLARATRYWGFGNFTVHHTLGVMFKQADKMPEEDLRRHRLRDEIEDLESWARAAHADADLYKKGKWTPESIYKRARDVGMEADYDLYYAFCCGASHSGAETIESALKLDDDSDSMARVHVGPQHPQHRLPLVIANQSFLRLAEVAVGHLGLDLGPIRRLQHDAHFAFAAR